MATFMPALIRVLPDTLINQIAAGEVVEDPRSALKELVENSLDAGASEVDIETVAGGYTLLRVHDNGAGMSRDDAVLCFERHATSKIRSSKDLEQIATMGFRGEALAAIASVSRVQLKTSLENGRGTLVEIHGGKLLRIEECSHGRGTTIEVRDLFYNTPARRKFQKSKEVSSSSIEKWLSQFSLGYPEVEFSFRETEKRSSFSSQEGPLFLDRLKKRMADVLGDLFTSRQIEVHEQSDFFTLEGFMSSPEEHRPRRTGQTLFINKRLTESKAISLAIKEAYATRLPEGRHPLFVFHCTISSDEIDVNVHPQKKEVRFRREEEVKEKTRKALLSALDKSKRPLFCQLNSVEKKEELFPWDLPKIEADPIKPLVESELFLFQPNIKPVQVMGHYLFLEEGSLAIFEKGMILVDLQRAVERLMYDRLTKELKNSSVEKLLIPMRLEVNKREAFEMRKRRASLEKMGFSISEMGEHLFLIEEIPAGLAEKEVLSTMFSFLSEKEEKISERFFHRCIKRKFSLAEALAITKALFLQEEFLMAPSGHPIVLSLEVEDVQKFFNKKALSL